jgi:glucokinase
LRVSEEAAQALASTIMNLVRVSDPDTIILGGGVA